MRLLVIEKKTAARYTDSHGAVNAVSAEVDGDEERGEPDEESPLVAIPTEAQSLFDFDSLTAGLLFVPLVLPYLMLGPLAAKGVDRYGPKPAAVIWIVLPGARADTSCVFPTQAARRRLSGCASSVALCGLGLALISSPSYVAEQYHKHNREVFGEQGPYAQLYAINSMVMAIPFCCRASSD